MIGALQRVSWLSVRRDPIVLGLTFVLPVVFYSVFAFIFGRGASSGGAPRVEVAIVDEDHTPESRRLTRGLQDLGVLQLALGPGDGDEAGPAFDRATAEAALREGRYSAVVVIPRRFGETFARKGRAAEPITLVYDGANLVARHMVAGLLQAAAHHAAPERLIARGLDQLEPFGAPITAEQRAALESLAPYLHGDADWSARPGAQEDGPGWAPGAPGNASLVPVDAVDVRGDERNVAAYYAAGIAVMFILFSMAGAGGALLAEEEAGTLERILSSKVSMGTLLASYFLFFVTLGVAEVTLMFVWGALVFDVELFVPHRLAGFAVMTLATACAAASFGLVLATLCRSRAQLSGVSTLLILLMSALGGSMVPRFVMPPFMDTVALFTFNGWAIDGYLRVFWYDDARGSVGATLASIAPQIAVLVAMSVTFFALARRLARRWEIG